MKPHELRSVFEQAQSQLKWDRRFLKLARFWALECSKDPSTKCCAIVVRPDRTIASMGYNGFAQGSPDTPAMYEDRERKYDNIIHSEMNALLFAREPLNGYTLYAWPFLPCHRCAPHITQKGIARIVAPIEMEEGITERWGGSVAKSMLHFSEAGVKVSLIELV